MRCNEWEVKGEGLGVRGEYECGQQCERMCESMCESMQDEG